jgi:hypothetical protein
MGHAGRILIAERFSMYSWARRLADIYAEATASPLAKELWTTD